MNMSFILLKSELFFDWTVEIFSLAFPV